ncbi:MAG: beta-galactosidase [Spirochaetaceae bacterium]|jgi:beta-galactosidase|nr:beta-galactosidase [Spirochaetaceae bacterium]
MKKPVRYPPIVASFPHILHGGDYNPDQWIKWKDTIWKEDMRLAKLAGINSLSVGIFAWSALEPAEGEFRFEWLDEVMDMLAENGMIAVLATPSGARPAWMSKKYPEVLRVNPQRQRNLHGERHNHCLSSPVYREKVKIINTKLAERYGAHPALGVWHISNEYGGECHCPLCQEKFRAYLKKVYGNLDALNEAWWTGFWSHTYADWQEIESPSPIGETNTHGLNLDWKRFTTEQFVDFYLWEIEPLRNLSPRIPCTTNLMGTYPGIDYYRLAEVLDVVSWDNYPQWTGTEQDVEIAVRASFMHDLTRGLKGKPFMLMESSPSATNWRPVAKLHRPGVHMLQSLQAVAHGADTVQYFQFRKGRGASEKFHGAVVDHEGTEHTRVFRDVAALGERLKTLDAVAGTDTPSRVALIYDWNVRWALEDIRGLLQKNTNYEQTVIDHYEAFWRMGIPVDIIDSKRSFDGYDLLAAPMLYLLREGTAEAIDGFVRRGGVFVATYVSGYVNHTDLAFPGGFPGPLKETLGIWCEEIDALYPGESNTIGWNGKKYRARDLCELIHPRGAEVLGTYGTDFYAGRPALTVHSHGKGRAYFIAARTDQDFLGDFYGRIAADCGLPRALDGLPFAPGLPALPEGVSARVRSDGLRDYVFVMNCGPRETTVNAGALGTKTLAPYEVWIAERNPSAFGCGEPMV